MGACATVAAKALESAVSTLGSGSKHWGVDVHSACGYRLHPLAFRFPVCCSLIRVLLVDESLAVRHGLDRLTRLAGCACV